MLFLDNMILIFFNTTYDKKYKVYLQIEISSYFFLICAKYSIVQFIIPVKRKTR